jgi:hypothetical protein
MHQLLVLFFVVGCWWHLKIDQLPQIVYCNFAIAIWIGDRVFRILRILRNNVRWKKKGIAFNVAEVTPLKGADAVKFSVELMTPFEYKPGSHVGFLTGNRRKSEITNGPKRHTFMFPVSAGGNRTRSQSPGLQPKNLHQ